MAPERAWSNLLIVSFYLVTLGVGGALFIALTYVSGASWNVAFRRIPEAMAVLLAPVGLGLLAVLAVRSEQYGWHPHGGGGDAGTFWFKELWTNPTFWMTRAIAYVALWILLSRALVAVSRRQDKIKDVGSDNHQPAVVGHFPAGVRADVFAGKLRLADAARPDVVQHDLGRLQFCRHGRRPRWPR